MEKRVNSQGRNVTPGLAAYLIAALGAIAILIGYLGIRRYTNESPRFCESCHEVAPEVAVWLESEHRGINCQACHHATMEEGLKILWVYLRGGMPDIHHAKVSVRSCASCHASHDRRWPEVANSSGHRVHSSDEGLGCTDCHGQQMHFDQPAREICVSCHKGQDAGSAHEPVHCLACHNFLSTEDSVLPQQRDCMRCHAKQDRPIVLPSTAPMQFVCSGCHEPHASGRIAPCADCHRPSELCGLHTHADHQKCGDCHEPHEWTSKRRHCLECHADLFSHYPERKCVDCHGFQSKECEANVKATR